MSAALNALYGYSCVHLAADDEEQLPFWKDTARLISRALKRVFKNPEKKPEDIDPDLWQVTYRTLDKAIEKGTAGIEYNKPNIKLTNQLRQSAALFSAQKTYAQWTALAAIAASKPGYQITWKEFLEQAKPIIGNYNQRWLKTEFNTAIRAARQASLWEEYEADADIYPNLRYMPSRAATPREEHKPYYGIVRPINDDFWIRHIPPSAWNCICGVEQTDDAITPLPAEQPRPVKGLDNNVGLTGKLFSDSHPYSEALNSEEKQFLTKQAYALLAESENFWELSTPKGNKIKVHPAYSTDDLQHNIEAAVILADNGFKVELPRHIHKDGYRQPDFMIDEMVADLKEPASDRKNLPNRISNSFKKLIDKADKQGVSSVVFHFKNSLMPIVKADLIDGIPRCFWNKRRINETIKQVIFIGADKKTTILTEGEISNKDWSALLKVKLPKQ